VLRGILGMEKLMSNVKVGVKKKKHISKESKKNDDNITREVLSRRKAEQQ